MRDRMSEQCLEYYKKLEGESEFLNLFNQTRLHSSRMRTARALTVSPSMLCAGGGVCSQGGVSRGVCSGGCLLWGVSALGGCLLPGGSAPGGVVSQHARNDEMYIRTDLLYILVLAVITDSLTKDIHPKNNRFSTVAIKFPSLDLKI